MTHTEKELADYIQDSISKDFLLTMLITSHTQGKLKSQNLPFGLGKTTLGFWLSYYLNKKSWDLVFEQLVYNPFNLVQLLKPGAERRNAVLWDGVQATAPSEQGVPKVIRRVASYLSETRPEIACLIMTASNINAISSPLRKLVIFEIIVADRGSYEVQHITYHKNFKKPLIDLSRLQYMEEGDFPKLPPEVYSRYAEWRIDEKERLYPALLQQAYEYTKLHEETEINPTLFNAPVIKTSGKYVIELPKTMGEKLHRQKLEVAIKT